MCSVRVRASNEAELSKSNGSAVIAAGGELYSGPAARSAVQIQAQQVQIRTAISWISTGPHPDARALDQSAPQAPVRSSMAARQLAHSLSSRCYPSLRCVPVRLVSNDGKGGQAEREQDATTVCTTWPRGHIRSFASSSGSSAAGTFHSRRLQPGTRSQPTGGSHIWRTRLRKALFCRYISWDG